MVYQLSHLFEHGQNFPRGDDGEADQSHQFGKQPRHVAPDEVRQLPREFYPRRPRANHLPTINRQGGETRGWVGEGVQSLSCTRYTLVLTYCRE